MADREDRDRRHRSRSRSPLRVERRRDKSPEHRRASRRSRSKSPRRRDERRRSPAGSKGGRRHERSDRRDRRSRSKERERSDKKRDRKEHEGAKINVEDVAATSEEDLMKQMGFAGFDTTKNKKVPGNVDGNAKVNKRRKYRQYMNRKGGFNRPLDYIA